MPEDFHDSPEAFVAILLGCRVREGVTMCGYLFNIQDTSISLNRRRMPATIIWLVIRENERARIVSSPPGLSPPPLSPPFRLPSTRRGQTIPPLFFFPVAFSSQIEKKSTVSLVQKKYYYLDFPRN